MEKIENHCVGCPQGCINCGRKHVSVTVCDHCSSHAVYNYEGEDYCKECFSNLVNNTWNNLSLSKQYHLLELDYDERQEFNELTTEQYQREFLFKLFDSIGDEYEKADFIDMDFSLL